MTMLMNRIREARNDEGFTLIELLIVIIVLGVLATIVVFGVGTFRQDAQTAACQADVKTVSVASDAYNARNGSYTTVANLVTAKYLESAPATAGTINAAGDFVPATPC